MSDQVAYAALSRMNNKEQLIDPSYTGFAQDMARLATVRPEEHERMQLELNAELCAAYGIGSADTSKSFAFSNGVAIIPVHGTLINRFGGSYSYVTGYNSIRARHNAALMDEDVKVIVHDHNSYGGEAAGCFELAEEIRDSRGTKPIIAAIDSNCYSASMALASAADKIVATPSSGVGSIGVVSMHVSYAKALDKAGIEVTFIHSGDHKVDGNPYEALSAATKADIQKGVDKSRAKFVSLVAGNLGLSEKVIYDTQARTYRADDALTLGLIHAIATPGKALQSVLKGDDGNQSGDRATSPSNQQEQDMSTTPTAAPTAAPAAAAAAATVDASAVQKAERERVSGILGCEEAKGRSALATHIALNTSLSLEEAKGMLAASPSAAAPEPTQAPTQAPGAAAAANFQAAMNAQENPNVGADGSGRTREQMSLAEQIIADSMAAQGREFDK